MSDSVVLNSATIKASTVTNSALIANATVINCTLRDNCRLITPTVIKNCKIKNNVAVIGRGIVIPDGSDLDGNAVIYENGQVVHLGMHYFGELEYGATLFYDDEINSIMINTAGGTTALTEHLDELRNRAGGAFFEQEEFDQWEAILQNVGKMITAKQKSEFKPLTRRSELVVMFETATQYSANDTEDGYGIIVGENRIYVAKSGEVTIEYGINRHCYSFEKQNIPDEKRKKMLDFIKDQKNLKHHS